MSVHVIEKQKSENKNMPKDFHIYLNLTVEYLGKEFGEEAVKEYLEEFTQEFYSCEIERIKQNGLEALADFIEKSYADEDALECISIFRSGGSAVVEVKKCPALEHIINCGYRPSRYFPLTSTVVYQKIANLCGLKFKMLSYSETGEAKYEFKKEG